MAIYIHIPIITLAAVNVSLLLDMFWVSYLLSTEQQITLYPHRDPNNLWRILNATAEADHELDWQTQPPEYVKPLMRVKLRHIQTDKALHSHDVRPPVSDVDFQNEVSAYGMAGFAGDTNDDWYVEIEKGHKSDKESGKRLRTLRTHFRLKHALTGCYLFSHSVKLPEWGWEQQEVTCNKNAVKANSLWFVETSTHPLCECHIYRCYKQLIAMANRML